MRPADFLFAMATTNPMKGTYPNSPPAVSKKTFTISGILTTVHGLEDLPAEATNVTCLWLLHPRLQTQSCMEPVAASAITDWNHRLKAVGSAGHTVGLIAASFDQRNHGSREVNKLANETWRSGNESHAQDMLGTYRSSGAPVFLLILLMVRRWDRNRCVPIDNLHFVLHFSHI